MASLSVCVFSDHAPRRLAAVVAPLRDVADEIVVIVGDRIADADLEPIESVADRTLVAPFPLPFATNVDWLLEQCSGDWVLRVDGDEVVSSSLVNFLLAGDWHGDATHLRVPRRWLVEEGYEWITSNPWWPDLQLRLIKNEPGVLRVDLRAHVPIVANGPGRILEAPIYHLDLIDRELEPRRVDSRRALRRHPGVRTEGGLGVGVIYTPELLTPAPPTEPVPDEDRTFIDAAIQKNHRIATHKPARTTEAAATTFRGRSASIELVHPDTQGFSGRRFEMLVTIANTGSERLDPFAAAPFRLGLQWLTTDGAPDPAEARSDLPSALEPGDKETVLTVAEIPGLPGPYALSVGAVDEGQQWLARAPESAFAALEQPHITVAGSISRHRHLGSDLVLRSLVEELTDEFPQVILTLLADDPDVATERFGVGAEPSAAGIGQDAAGEPPAGLVEAITRSDVFIISAAGSLASSETDTALWSRLAEAEIAEAAGVPMIITSAGVGPFTSDRDRDAARRLLGMAREVHVRDRLALEALTDLDVRGPVTIVVPDASSGVRGVEESEFAAFLVDNELDSERDYIAVSARPDDGDDVLEQIAKSVGAAARTLDASVVLVPHCVGDEVDDRPTLGRLAAVLGTELDVVGLEDVPPDPLAADLLRNASISIGSRFHNAALSAAAGHPAVLFCDTEYDQRRAEGLAALTGTTVEVMSGSARRVSRRTRAALSRPTNRLRYPEPHPLMTVIHALGVSRRAAR